MYVNVAILKETLPHEGRVALTPTVAPRLYKLGARLHMQTGAAESLHLGEADYPHVAFIADPAALVAEADVVLAVQPPAVAIVDAMKPGAILICADRAPAPVQHLIDKRITCFAMERVPRIGRAQAMDALSSQSALAGYCAVVLGATQLTRMLPKTTTAAGAIGPGKVLVRGLGVAGLEAIATAHRLGAVVEGDDVRPETAEQARSLGQILVQTETCGVCHTDLHAARGDWPVEPASPFTPGHEGIGIVTALGSGVTAAKEGDRVGVPWLYSACGHCEYCLGAREPVCAGAEFGGHTKNGGIADFIVADPNHVAHIPAGLAPREAAPLICAGITSYKGIKETQAKPGEWIVISGIGGLGHLGVQYAKAMGLQVCAVDIDDGKLAHAARLGADAVVSAVVNTKQGDPVEAVRQATGGGAHGVLITAPSLPAFRQGVGMTRKFGTCVLVGIPPGELPTPLFDALANCITLRGSFVGSRGDIAEALAFGAAGRVKADIELQPLAAINRVFQRLAPGDVPSRGVLEYSVA